MFVEEFVQKGCGVALDTTCLAPAFEQMTQKHKRSNDRLTIRWHSLSGVQKVLTLLVYLPESGMFTE
jgi:hypothetical protein